MTHPPVYHRDRALRRLSLVTKGLALSAILATGGVVAAIAHASPAQQSAGSTPKAPGSADRVSVPRNTAPQPASRGRSRLPTVPTATGRTARPGTTAPQRRGAAPNRSTGSNPAPPPAPPTVPPEPAPNVPEPSPSGGS
jgi:hypothetical protein